MGLEFILTTRQLTLAKWQQVIDCFEAASTFHRLEFSWDLAIKAGAASYAFTETNRTNWPEDFHLSRDPAGFYVCFSSATSQQIDHVITRLTSCLSQAAIIGKFEEL